MPPSAAPFGTSTRRRLNMTHLEILQDLTLFRFIPDAKAAAVIAENAE